MSWIPELRGERRRRRVDSLPRTIELLETRVLLADGITAAAGPPINAVAGMPITNAVFATYTVTDPSGEPGAQWRALINFGDGHSDGPVIPVEKGEGFEFIDTHTYNTPGTYTVTVMIAVPGSMKPNNNTVTTHVTVTTPTSTPTPTPTPTPPSTPTPTPTPPIGQFKAFGLTIKARANKTFHGNVAVFSEPHSKAQNFSAIIDWGDQSSPTSGQVRRRGKGRFALMSTHRYAGAGVFQVMVTIRDAAGKQIAAKSLVHVRK